MDITGTRWHIQDEIIEFPPIHIVYKLFYGTAYHWPTPNYSLEQFDFTHLPWVDMDEVVWPILQASMQFNMVKDLSPSAAAARQAHHDLPDTLSIAKTIIMEYRRRYSVVDMLLAYGYTAVGRCRFRRPGGRSGSLLVSDDHEIAVAFSSSDPLNQHLNALGKNFHDSFGIYTVIEHAGDVKAALASVAHDFGIAYHRSDYSDHRPHDLHTAGEGEVAFYAGDSENEAVFMVDDQDSAAVLRNQGCAALYVPLGTEDVGGWTAKAIQDAGHEVRSAVRVLLAKADNAPLIEAQERIRIDIFLRDNLP